LLAIDPGDELSAYVVYETEWKRPVKWEKQPNDEMLRTIDRCGCEEIAIEAIASYGMPVGATIFTTCIWVGRYIERWSVFARPEPRMIFRKDVKMHLCGSPKAKDGNVRQALIDRYGPGKERAIGKKATPGPLYGMTSDCWAALGVAITAVEQEQAPQVFACVR
jgi:hypothetical protein